MKRLLKKGDVFILAHGHLAGEYVVSCIEETAISTSPIYENRVWCLQAENPEKGISFYQSDKYTPCVGDIKVIGHATQATPGKWDVVYFKKKEPDETWTLKFGAEDIARIFGVPQHLITDTTDEKMENKKVNDFDYTEIMKDAIGETVKKAIESTANRIIKDFREGMKKVIGN